MPLLGERLSPRQWLGLTLGAVGVVLVVAPRVLEDPAAWGAVRLGFVGAASLAAGTVYFGRFGRDVPLVPATAVQLGAAAILTVALTIVFEHPHAVWTFPAVASVAWNVLAVSVGAMALYYYMLSHGTAGRVAANFYLIPGTVALLGWTLLGESLTLLAALGGRDVVVAVVVRGGPGRVRPVVFSLSGPPSRWPGACAADHFPSSRSRN